MSWTLAARAAKMNPSVIREILKVTEQPGIISFAGGLPSAQTFPVAEFAAACAKVLQSDAPAALQYAASEGFGPLREIVAADLARHSAAAGTVKYKTIFLGKIHFIIHNRKKKKLVQS